MSRYLQNFNYKIKKLLIREDYKIKNLLISGAKLILGILYRRFALLMDWINGTDFEKLETIDELCLKPENSEQYEATKGFEIRKVIRDIPLKNETIAIDFGSGKGRMLCFFIKQQIVKKVYGIEISGKLVEIARHNIQKLGLTGISILNMDAIETPDKLIDESNLFYLYNPFPKTVFDSVIRKIEFSLIRNKREAYLIYFNPIHQATIEDSPMFAKYGTYNNLISTKTAVFKSRFQIT